MSTDSLYQRLGGTEGISALVQTVVGLHLDNPLIRKRFEPIAADPERLAIASQHLCNFLEAGTGGPAKYTGKSMIDAHRGMNISGEEYLAATDDIMKALDRHEIDGETKKEILFVLYSLKPEITRV